MSQAEKGAPGALKNELFNALMNLCYAILFILIITLFHLGLLQVIILVWLINIVLFVYDIVRRKKRMCMHLEILALIRNSIFSSLLIILLVFLARFGWIGYVLSIAIICSWIMFRRWKQFMVGIRRLETALYGKPLDRELWNKGEFKGMLPLKQKDVKNNDR